MAAGEASISQPALDLLARVGQRGPGVEAEHRPQDHVERDVLELVLQLDRLAARPVAMRGSVSSSISSP